MTDDQALAHYLEKADPDAFNVLIQRYQGLVASACARHLSDRHDVEDAVQETFLKLIRFADKVETNLASWLYTTAVNTAIDLRRKRRRQPLDQSSSQASQTALTQNQNAYAWELTECIDQVMAELTETQRQCLIQRYFLDQNFEQMAQQAGVSKATMHRRVQEALDHLRKRLHQRGVLAPAAALTAFLLAQTAHAAMTPALTASLQKLGVSGVGAHTSATAVGAAGAAKMKLFAIISVVMLSAAIGVWWLLASRVGSSAGGWPASMPATVSDWAKDQSAWRFPKDAVVGVYVSRDTAISRSGLSSGTGKLPHTYEHSDIAKVFVDAGFQVVALVDPGSENDPELLAVVERLGLTDSLVRADDAESVASLDLVVSGHFHGRVSANTIDALHQAVSGGTDFLNITIFAAFFIYGDEAMDNNPPLVRQYQDLMGLEEINYLWNLDEPTTWRVSQTHPILTPFVQGDLVQTPEINGYVGVRNQSQVWLAAAHPVNGYFVGPYSRDQYPPDQVTGIRVVQLGAGQAVHLNIRHDLHDDGRTLTHHELVLRLAIWLLQDVAESPQ